MRELLTIVPRLLIGFGAGTLIAGGTVAFITMIGIIPIMAHRTKTMNHAMLYEDAIVVGSVTATILTMFTVTIKLWPVFISLLGFCFGIFNGVLIIALAEVVDAFPIVDRRLKLKKGVSILVIAFALGKIVGGLMYYLYPVSLEIMN